MTIFGLQLHYSGSVNLSFSKLPAHPKAFLTLVVYHILRNNRSRACFLVCGMDLHTDTQKGLGNPEHSARERTHGIS